MNNVVNLNPKLFQNKLLITHTDLDGVGCAFIFLKCYPKCRIIYADYHNVDDIVMDILDEDGDEDIMISDLSVGPEVAKILDRRGKVSLLDHHDTAKWLADKYPWAMVDNTRCGTRLVYDLLKHYFHLEDLEWVVDLIEDWDLWGAARGADGPSPSAIQFNLLLDFYGRTRFLEKLLMPTHASQFHFDPEVADILLRKVEAYCEETADLMEVHSKDGYHVGLFVAEQYKSLVGDYILRHFDLEYVVILDPRHGRASLRGKGNIHLGELAKKAGGGGHRKAAGFPMSGLKHILGGN